MAWSYYSNGKQYGPVSQTELKFHISSGSVKPTDRVFGPGMVTWVTASEVTAMIQDTPTETESITARATEQVGLTEGEFASSIGNTLIWLSLISATICIFAFGRIEVSDLYGSTKTAWSPFIVVAIIAGGLNGVFFGYLLAKVGSVLRKLEKATAV